jgi:hypothetical protein
VSISAEHVPVSRGGGGIASLGSLPTDVGAGVVLDAPAVFGAWLIGGQTSSFGVVDARVKDVAYPPGPKPDWIGTYGPAPGPAGSGNGIITVKDGQASISINWSSAPSNGAFACNVMVTGNHGCVNQTITCSGTAFIPEFAP